MKVMRAKVTQNRHEIEPAHVLWCAFQGPYTELDQISYSRCMN